MDNGEKLEKKIEKAIEGIENNIAKIKELDEMLNNLNSKEDEV